MFNFQDHLKKLRDIDDKLVYALNVSIPTQSFKGQVHAEENCKGTLTCKMRKIRKIYDFSFNFFFF